MAIRGVLLQAHRLDRACEPDNWCRPGDPSGLPLFWTRVVFRMVGANSRIARQFHQSRPGYDSMNAGKSRSGRRAPSAGVVLAVSVLVGCLVFELSRVGGRAFAHSRTGHGGAVSLHTRLALLSLATLVTVGASPEQQHSACAARFDARLWRLAQLLLPRGRQLSAAHRLSWGQHW